MNYHDNDTQVIVQVQPDETYKNLVDESLTTKQRVNFIRKVYCILSVQLAFVTLMVYMTYSNPPLQVFMVTNWVVLILLLVVYITCCCFLVCSRNCRRKTPQNYLLLALVTFCLGYLVAATCAGAFLTYSNAAELVMFAVLFTLILTVSLTIIALLTKFDFTVCGWFLFICALVLFVISILLFFTNSPALSIFISACYIVLYSIYLIVDTQLIAGGKRHELDMDDYILGALFLFLDIIILFLEILNVLLLVMGKK